MLAVGTYAFDTIRFIYTCDLLHCSRVSRTDVFFTQWRYLATLAFLYQFPYLATIYIGRLPPRPYNVIIVYLITQSTLDAYWT